MNRVRLLALGIASLLAGGAVRIVQDQCGPFTDVTPAFCPFVSELYYLGITAGTSATTFSPDDPLTRGQAAVFVAKGLNQSLARSSRRAALGQWWTTTPHYELGLGTTMVDPDPLRIASDGEDIWVANQRRWNGVASAWKRRQAPGNLDGRIRGIGRDRRHGSNFRDGPDRHTRRNGRTRLCHRPLSAGGSRYDSRGGAISRRESHSTASISGCRPWVVRTRPVAHSQSCTRGRRILGLSRRSSRVSCLPDGASSMTTVTSGFLDRLPGFVKDGRRG